VGFWQVVKLFLPALLFFSFSSMESTDKADNEILADVSAPPANPEEGVTTTAAAAVKKPVKKFVGKKRATATSESGTSQNEIEDQLAVTGSDVIHTLFIPFLENADTSLVGKGEAVKAKFANQVPAEILEDPLLLQAIKQVCSSSILHLSKIPKGVWQFQFRCI